MAYGILIAIGVTSFATIGWEWYVSAQLRLSDIIICVLAWLAVGFG